MRIFLSSLLIISATVLMAQSPEVFQLESRQRETLTYQMDLDTGNIVSDLSWAWDGQNVCFVESRKDWFTGNHVFFRTEIPKYSTMVIRLIPKEPNQNMSLYAYSGGHGALPHSLHGCVSGEADFHQKMQHQPAQERPPLQR